MPFLNHSQVSPLPLPSSLPQLPASTEVWVISQTAEVFTDYESYANRYLFYSQPLFLPNVPLLQSPHSQLMSFFEALNLEHHHLDRLIQSNFPPSLKPRLLSSILLPSAQFQPTIDHLVDYLYDLYYNRFDVNERVVVDLAFNQSPSVSSSLHDARVIRVFPPKPIRDLDKNSYSDLIHLRSLDHFQLDLNKCLEIDDPKAYLYTIQLIDDQKSKSGNFGASYMEVETRKLSRHQDSFSKALVKRFLQSVLLPYSPTSSSAKWTIHPDISLHPDSSNIIPLPAIPVPTHTSMIKHLTRNQAATSKQDPSEPDFKRPKKNTSKCLPSESSITQSLASLHHQPSRTSSKPMFTRPHPSNIKHKLDQSQEPQSPYLPSPINCQMRKKMKKKSDSTHSTTHTISSHPNHNITLISEIPKPPDHSENLLSATTPTTATRESKKPIKYPIEDLDLDPLTVIDGRYLRRVNLIPMKLPKKPQPVRQKLSHKFAQKLKIWSFTNIFRLNERRCRFEEFDKSLDDLTACLVRLILRQTQLRYPNTRPNKYTSISVLPFFATRPAQECTVMSINEREYWVRKGLRFLNIHQRSLNSNKKRRNQETVEDNWVMGLVEIICHRGGIERLGCTARILKAFFSADATLLTIDHARGEDDQLNDSDHLAQNSHSKPQTAQANTQPSSLNFDGDSPLTSNIDENSDDAKSDLSVDESSIVEDFEPENGMETGDEDAQMYGRSIRHQQHQAEELKQTLTLRFGGLPIDDKLTLIDFLCDLAMESDKVRNYMEECDERLTVVRKEKADVNKEKRKVLEDLARIESRKSVPTTKALPLSSEEITISTKDCEPSPFIDQFKPKPMELANNHPPAPPTELSEVSTLESQHTNEPAEEVKPKLSQSKPITPTLCSSNPEIMSDLSSKLLPHIKTSIKKLETTKQPINRPLETHVRIATLAARQIKEPNCVESNEIEFEKQQLEKQLYEIGLKELQLQERFRQLIGVTKLKPLGVDRFYCKYWWFDGIGGMEIHSDNDERNKNQHNQQHLKYNQEQEDNGVIEKDNMNWYSGCLFVSGPCAEEWDKMCETYGGHDQILKRRLREEFSYDDDDGDQHSLNNYQSSKTLPIGVDEWGIYETEDQIEELMNWLNSKGIRENSLKMNLKEWKEYIAYGIQDRNKFLSLSSTRTVATSKNHDHIESEDLVVTNQPQQDRYLIGKNGFNNCLTFQNGNHEYSDESLDELSSHNGQSIATDHSFNHEDHLDDENYD